jgi:hypothetical protein
MERSVKGSWRAGRELQNEQQKVSAQQDARDV